VRECVCCRQGKEKRERKPYFLEKLFSSREGAEKGQRRGSGEAANRGLDCMKTS